MPLEMVRNENEERPFGPPRYHGVRVNWGSIFCGTFASMGLSLLALLLGNAIGLGALNMVSATAGNGLKAATFIYTIVTLGLAFYAGGMGTSLAGELTSRVSGMVHGFISWALALTSVVAYGIVFSSIFRAVVGGIGPSGANWLVALTTIFSCGLAMVGGGIGASRARQRMLDLEAELKEMEETRSHRNRAA